MASADDALSIARSYLGQGPDSFWAWYPAPAGTAWCCIAQSRFLTEAGIPTHYAWVSALFDRARAEGRTYAPHQAQPGDLVAFDYDGGGPSAYDHIAMVEAVTADGIVAINGNWGGRVARVLHRWGAQGLSGGIAEIARPIYDAPAPTPAPAPAPAANPEVLVRRFIRAQSSPKVYLADAGCSWKIWCSDESRVRDFGYAIRQSGVPLLDPPAGAKIEIIAGEKVWVVSDAFAGSIPTAG